MVLRSPPWLLVHVEVIATSCMLHIHKHNDQTHSQIYGDGQKTLFGFCPILSSLFDKKLAMFPVFFKQWFTLHQIYVCILLQFIVKLIVNFFIVRKRERNLNTEEHGVLAEAGLRQADVPKVMKDRSFVWKSRHCA